MKITLPTTESCSTSLITQDIRYCREVDKLSRLKDHLSENHMDSNLIFVETKFKCD